MIARAFVAAAVAAAAAMPLAVPAVAQQEAPRAFACTFKTGSTVNYSKGVYRAKPAVPLELEFGDIDLDAQKASLVTSKGRGALSVVRAVNANHFLEVISEGFLNITTIYDADPRRKLHPAVHSRHFGLFGEPQIAQYHGFCSRR